MNGQDRPRVFRLPWTRWILGALLVGSALIYAACQSSPAPTPLPVPTNTPLPAATSDPPIRNPVRNGGSLSTFDSMHFSGSGNCAVCHSGLFDAAGTDVSIDSHWRSTMMANGSKDPLWQAKVSSEVQRSPALRSVIEDKCATCHMPMARTQAFFDGEDVSMLGDGFLSSQNPSHELAMDGISCSLCHQIDKGNLGQDDSYSGHFEIDSETVRPDRLIYGPFANPFASMMRNNVGFTPVLGAQVGESALCGTCHTLYTPIVDAEGNVQGEFPEQTLYLEWEHSAYAQAGGKTCQNCHMPQANGGVVISNRPMGRMIGERSPFSQHYFVGGNTTMLELLLTNLEPLGLTARSMDLEATLTRTEQQLTTKSAQLEIVQSDLSDETLEVTVQVSNLAGHKFPAGFPSRRLWLHLIVKDTNGEVTFESGQPGSDGSILGNAADEDATRYEPHYELISEPDQVQIYEAIMQDGSGEVTYTLLRAQSYAKDNRLLPKGFDDATAEDDYAVWGGAKADENFDGGTDRVTFSIDVTQYEAPYAVQVELLWQTVGYRFLEDLLHDRTNETEAFQSYSTATLSKPVVVTSVESSLR